MSILKSALVLVQADDVTVFTIEARDLLHYRSDRLLIDASVLNQRTGPTFQEFPTAVRGRSNPPSNSTERVLRVTFLPVRSRIPSVRRLGSPVQKEDRP